MVENPDGKLELSYLGYIDPSYEKATVTKSTLKAAGKSLIFTVIDFFISKGLGSRNGLNLPPIIEPPADIKNEKEKND